MKLTREQIENMLAGREIDLAIAQEFTGSDIYDAIEWREWAWKYNELSYPCGFYDEFGVFIVTAEGTMGKYFSPSTDIAAAWDVVEKLNSICIWVSVSNKMTNSLQGFVCEFSKTYYEEVDIVEAETAPLAICRAALIAMMEEK